MFWGCIWVVSVHFWRKVLVGIHDSVNEMLLLSASSPYRALALWHHQAWLMTKHVCLCAPHLLISTHVWDHLNQVNLSLTHQGTEHCSSNPCPWSASLQQTVCSLVHNYLPGMAPMQTNAVCSLLLRATDATYTMLYRSWAWSTLF